MNDFSIVDSYAVMTQLSESFKHSFDFFEYRGEKHYRQHHPYVSDFIQVSFISMTENNLLVFLITYHAAVIVKKILEDEKYNFEIIDYDTTWQFRIKMNQEQMVDFHINFINLMEKVENILISKCI